jgi:hypothetical protein
VIQFGLLMHIAAMEKELTEPSHSALQFCSRQAGEIFRLYTRMKN